MRLIVDIKIEKIVFSKRKTIALQMTQNATLVIKAPLNTSEDSIWKIVNKHKNWICKKKREIESRELRALPKKFTDTEEFLFLGRYYRLYLVEDQKEALRFQDNFYLSKNALVRAKDVFIEWYKKTGYEKIAERAYWWAQRTGLKFSKINITRAQRRWGSCSKKGTLNFSWRLVMAPLSVIDYVIVHELVHLEEKNHGNLFWRKVEMLIPDYKDRENWLRKNGYLLSL